MAKFDSFDCIDCGVNTHYNNEYYMVTDDLWESAGMDILDGMLCIGCLEDRIGRRLNPEDFPDYPVNSIFKQSERLINRIKLTSESMKIIKTVLT